MKAFGIILFSISLIFFQELHGQFLEISRPAIIHSEPDKHSQGIEDAETGQYFWLLDQGKKTKRYYHVISTDGFSTGYIYRSRAKKHEGQVPGSPTLSYNKYSVTSTSIDYDPNVPTDYYDPTEGLNGTELKQALHEIIRQHKFYAYSADTTDVWDILKETDRDPANPDNVILIYSGYSVDAAQEWMNRQGWEKEHIWSQSHGQFGRDRSIPGCDVHHIRPIKPEFNGSRGKSDKDFDESGEPFLLEGHTTGCFVTDSTWAPIEQVRGDVARMMFYMAVRYEGNDGYPDLELIDEDNTSSRYTSQPLYGKLSTLLRWHREDPVDNWERRRNDIIYEKYQGNRNPFIDHPEFAEMIWGDL